MTTIQERLESLWYSRRIEKPYERDNQIFINVYSSVLERGLDDQEYLTNSAKIQAASLILDYYGRAPENQNIINSVSLESIHFPSRLLSSPILKISIPKTAIDDAEQLIGDAQNYSFLFTSDEIRNFQNTINSLFPVYQQQLKFFNGSVAPNINFLDLQDKVALFFDNLDSFITFNGYNIRQFQKVGIKLDSDFMVQSVILQKKEVNNLVNIPITNGVKFYFKTKKEGSNKYVNEIVSNAKQIMLDAKMKINWTQFVYNYLSESGVSINFYGKPRTETEASQANSEQEQGPFGPLASTKQEIEGIRASINNQSNQQKAFQEANKEIESINASLQSRLRDIASEIENANNEAEKIKGLLDRYNISTLIEAALECLLFKQGFNGAIPDFLPGSNPFEPQSSAPNFKLPEIPVKLPIISINKQLQIQIRENLERAALSALMAAIEAVAAIIREFCLRDDADTPSTPAQNVVNDFLSPLEDENALNNCYRDFNFIVSSPELFEIPTGLTESSVLEAYLTDLSPHITPRELCDLFNDVGSDDVLQIAGNIIDSSWPQLRQNFPDGEAIQSFFACLGNLVDPSYCAGVYNDQTQTIPNVDPCTIEDSQPYQDIVELLENVNSLYDTPDMSCGAGVVPALANIPSYNDSVTRMIDSIVSTIQQVFVNDLGNFKESVLVPKPLEPTDQRRLQELESLLQFLTLPEESEEQKEKREKNSSFFNKLIPEQLSTQVSDFENIHAALTTQASQTAADNIKDILAKQEFLVAPETRTTYEEIEDNFLTASVLMSGDMGGARFYSFASSLNYGRSLNGRDVLYSLPINTQQQNDSVDVLVTPLTEGSESLKNKTLDISKYPDGNQFIEEREFLAGEFSGKIFDYLDDVVGNVAEEQLKDISIKRLYPYFYFGLINSLAYKVSVSDLFNADAMNSLNLFPKLCKDGSISNSDLLDVNSIKQSALQEFVDNSCIDREFELGPVRDSGVLAIVELYMQVIIVDLVLKNIFMTSKFGIDYLGDSDSIVNELLNQTVEDIRLGSVNGTLGPYNRLPKVVKQGASMVIKKVINRSLEPNTAPFTYPISGELPEVQQQFVDSNNFEPSGVSIDNPTMQNIATQYLFEKRLLGTADKIKEFFKVPGDTYIQNYLYNGTQFVDMKQMDLLAALNKDLVGAPDSATDYFTNYNYIDQGREVYDLYYSADSDVSTATSFSGSVSQQRIEKESNSFLTYGTFVAEKYFEVTYSEEGLEQLDIPDVIKNLIREQFEQLTPMTPEYGFGTSGENYLLSFEKMIEILYSIVPAVDLRAAIKKDNFKFYLTGYNHASEKPIQRREIKVEVGLIQWNDSSPSKMSDYTLLRDWWKAVSLEGLPILAAGQLNPIKFDLYGPLNLEKINSRGAGTDWRLGVPTSGQLKLKEYDSVNIDGITITPKSIDSGPGGDDIKGTFLFNVETFRGKKVFGYYEDDGFSLEKSVGLSDWRAAQRLGSYTVAESKNFAVVVSPEYNVDDVGDPDPSMFSIGIKRKYSNGQIAGGASELYSTIDLYDGGILDDEYQEFRYSKIVELFQQYENEQSLMVQNIVVDEDGTVQQSLNDLGAPPTLSQIFENALPSIEMKTRMVYVTPKDESLGSYFDNLAIDEQIIESQKSFYPIDNTNDSSRHIATQYKASIDVTSIFKSTTFLTNFAADGADVYINNLFEDNKPELVQQLAVSLESLMGSPSPVNLASVMQYLYIIGEIKTYYDLFSNDDIFTDTKALLVLALQAAFGSVEDSPCDVDALQNALLRGADRSLAPIAAMGQSFLNKMLKETPKYILKGVVELTEPHVIVGKKIKDTSRGIFQKIKTAETFAALQGELPEAPAGNADCGPDIPELNASQQQAIQQSNADIANLPSLEEIISQMQAEIDRVFPDGFPDALKPSVTERGIDLVGTIPYTLFNPPITPFGIVYLLLRLSEFGQQELQIDDSDC